MSLLQRLWQTLEEWVFLLLPLLVTVVIVFGAFGLYVKLGLPFIKNATLMLPAPKSLDELAKEARQAASKGDKERPQEPTASAVGRYSGYLVWASFVGLLMMFLLVACFTGIYILAAINRSAPPCGSGLPMPYLAWAIFVISVPFIIAFIQYTPTTVPLLKSTLLHPVAPKGLPPILAMMKWLDKLGLVAASYLALVTTIIVPPRGCVEVSNLHQRVGFLRMILYIGTTLLVTDIIQYGALLRWSVAFVDLPNKSSIESLIATLVSLRGLFSTTYLAAIFLPAALILEARAHAAVPSEATPNERREWLGSQGLIPTSIFAQVVAILLPLLTALLTGPVAGVVKEIVKRV